MEECRRRDSNPHGSGSHRLDGTAHLPVSPLRHFSSLEQEDYMAEKESREPKDAEELVRAMFRSADRKAIERIESAKSEK